ncbi:MerR family transcriptional regulator [Oenococcus sp.]|uniref:MerR family transcriptional regulator n=1 Tax=Oenococcus sp. TaxID=1979414 RepID=UPI0039EA7F0A
MTSKVEKNRYIGDVSAEFGLSIYALRYYEKIGLLNVPRDENGIRLFDADNLARVDAIVHYRRAGLTIKQIQHIFVTPDQDEQHLQILFKAKRYLNQKISDLMETMKYLNFKIDYHQTHLNEKESHTR